MRNPIRAAYCRAFQLVFRLALPFLPYREPKQLDDLTSIPPLLQDKSVTCVLLVTDRSIRSLGLTAPLERTLGLHEIQCVVYDGTVPNPTVQNVEEARTLYLDHGAQAIIAVGGGSVMDCAKAVGARIARPNKPVQNMKGLLRVLRRTPLTIAVPTTAGTGSETTLAAVITDPVAKHKYPVNDFALIPDYAVLDPAITLGLPPFITATTGMDALCHAVEAYTNHTYNTRLENRYAEEAVKLIHENLLTAYHDGKNLQARQNMQLAAFKAGRASTRRCVGYVHAIGHTLGGLYGTPHGLAMSILLPHVMREFGPAVRIRLARLADVCGMGPGTVAEKAERFIQWIVHLKQERGIPEKLDMIQDEDVPQIITWAMKEGNPLYPVPVLWGREEFRQFIDKVRA